MVSYSKRSTILYNVLLSMHSNELQPRHPGIDFRQKGLSLSFFTETQLELFSSRGENRVCDRIADGCNYTHLWRVGLSRPWLWIPSGWAVTPCILVDSQQHFGGTCFLHIQVRSVAVGGKGFLQSVDPCTPKPSGAPRGGLGVQPPPPPRNSEVWQSCAEFPVPWKIHP
jgi:hypothetical protein